MSILKQSLTKGRYMNSHGQHQMKERSFMNIKSLIIYSILVITLFYPLLSQAQAPQKIQVQEAPARPPRIAIGNFEYKGVMHLRDGTSPFVDMVSTALVKTRKFKLVERNRVNEALNEMGLGEAGVVDPNDCQKLGTLVKADLLLFGTITQASLDNKLVVMSGIRTSKETMRMTVDIRIIDAKTGEIKTAETITKTKIAAKSVNIPGSISTGESSSGIVGDVMRDVANGVVEKLVEGVYPITIDMVRDDGQLKINYGAPMIKANSTYKVYDSDGFSVGQILITDVHKDSSNGKIISGNVQKGMICKKTSESPSSSNVKVQEIPW